MQMYKGEVQDRIKKIKNEFSVIYIYIYIYIYIWTINIS